MPQFYTMLTPVETLPDTAYYLDDVIQHMSPHYKKRLTQWLEGKTLILIDEKEIIYKYELERFFDTL
jgi:hypothetical protein